MNWKEQKQTSPSFQFGLSSTQVNICNISETNFVRIGICFRTALGFVSHKVTKNSKAENRVGKHQKKNKIKEKKILCTLHKKNKNIINEKERIFSSIELSVATLNIFSRSSSNWSKKKLGLNSTNSIKHSNAARAVSSSPCAILIETIFFKEKKKMGEM